MNNDPILFIDSIIEKQAGNENQEHFDSRTVTRKKVARHRLEDIEAMLYYRIHVLAEVYTKAKTYEGVVLNVSEYGLRLQIENEEIEIPINDIQDINILKL